MVVQPAPLAEAGGQEAEPKAGLRETFTLLGEKSLEKNC